LAHETVAHISLRSCEVNSNFLFIDRKIEIQLELRRTPVGIPWDAVSFINIYGYVTFHFILQLCVKNHNQLFCSVSEPTGQNRERNYEIAFSST